MEPRRALFVTVVFICFAAASAFPETFLPQRLDKLDRKEIGNRIAVLFPSRPVILASDPRVGFYARREILGIWGTRTFAELLEHAHIYKVDLIVMNKRRLHDEGKLGDLARDFFEHSAHPDLELLFVYPAEDQSSSSRFYVYRLVGERKQPGGAP